MRMLPIFGVIMALLCDFCFDLLHYSNMIIMIKAKAQKASMRQRAAPLRCCRFRLTSPPHKIFLPTPTESLSEGWHHNSTTTTPTKTMHFKISTVANVVISHTAPVQNEPGIISAAIANATQNMSNLPTTPTYPTSAAAAKGQENVSMLQQHASKSPPQKTDFTFTPEGGVNGPRWPGGQMPPGVGAGGYAHSGAIRGGGPAVGRNGAPVQAGHGQTVGQATHYPPPAMQTTAQHHGQQATAGAAAPAALSANPNAALPQQAAPATAPQQQKPRKPRPLGRTFDIAARRRKLQKEYSNFNSPPKREDIWICEFCEYESIFGVPPKALIWEYEKKDQAERKRLEERRRLLEKAKMKGRKGGRGKKKGGKNSAQATTANNQAANTNAGKASAHAGQEYYEDPNAPVGEEDAEYYEDGEYEEGYEDGVEDPDMPPLVDMQNTPGAYPPDIPPPPDPRAYHGHEQYAQQMPVHTQPAHANAVPVRQAARK